MYVNSLSVNLTKWSNTLKQFVGNLPTNCFSVFDHFVRLALKGLKTQLAEQYVVNFKVKRSKSKFEIKCD